MVVVMSQSAGSSGTEVGTCQEPHTVGIRQDVLDVQAVLDVMITSIEGVDNNVWWQTHSAGHTFPINMHLTIPIFSLNPDLAYNWLHARVS